MARNEWWDKIIGKVKPKREDDGRYRPSYRDSIYRPEHGSGWVKDIDYKLRTVYVVYSDGHRQEYRWDDLEDTYIDRYGGIWVPDY